jgi:hypothetical protein
MAPICQVLSPEPITYLVGVSTALRRASSTLPSICTLNTCPPSPNSLPSQSERKNVNLFTVFMSSIGQAESSTSNFQLIVDAALTDYTKITGTDLSQTPFAITIQQSNSLETILQLLHEREKTFKEYRDGNRKLINFLTPPVKIFQAFSGILGQAVNVVSGAFHPVTLLTVTSSDSTPTNKRLVCCHRYSPCCASI